ncbi:hypothetical protein [Paenibacillus elgii]|uniref:hypothetical protein n=1 Tax=Paenibacillus elgii TaxID=189691 RepID=UPI00203EA7AF|nr:hypothetical protein [Paenibacillus elgii]MCM3271033.1 hypothetical protein [Paenibacillus elgii]
MNKKSALIATALCCVVALSTIGTSAIAKIDPSAKPVKVAKLEAEFATKEKKFYAMPNQTKEEQDAVVSEGKSLKSRFVGRTPVTEIRLLWPLNVKCTPNNKCDQ